MARESIRQAVSPKANLNFGLSVILWMFWRTVLALPKWQAKYLLGRPKIWSNPRDDEFERVVTEAPDACTRVLIETRISGFQHKSTERIDASMLELL
jgi:hypothetical protein